MEELAKCRLCGGDAYEPIGVDIPYTTCSNHYCEASKHLINKEVWNLLNAPDPRVAELEASISMYEEAYKYLMEKRVVSHYHEGNIAYADDIEDAFYDLNERLKAASEGKDNA